MKKVKAKDQGHEWSESCCESCIICGERKFYWDQLPVQFQKCPGPRKVEPPKMSNQEIISRLADALRFYANGDYSTCEAMGSYSSPMDDDAGTKARSVLKEVGLEKVDV